MLSAPPCPNVFICCKCLDTIMSAMKNSRETATANNQKEAGFGRGRWNLRFGIFLNVGCWMLVFWLFLCHSVRATDRFWTNTAGGTFNASGNWAGTVVP